MTWKRSAAGTPSASTSARCTASPKLRRCAAVRPLTTSIRTRGMAEEVEHGLYEQAMHRFGALAPRLLGERLEVELVQLAAGHHVSETAASPPRELTIATPGWRRR